MLTGHIDSQIRPFDWLAEGGHTTKCSNPIHYIKIDYLFYHTDDSFKKISDMIKVVEKYKKIYDSLS